MPAIADRERIRGILERDRPWGAYALADLEPGFYELTRWYAPETGEGRARDLSRALLLVYRGLGIPILLPFGTPGEVRPLLAEAEEELAGDAERFFVALHEHRPLIEERHRFRAAAPMLRMRLDAAAFEAAMKRGSSATVATVAPPVADSSPPEPLGLEAMGELEALFADGASSGESPEFFTRDMLAQGTYHGIREEGRLTAAAGTHVFAPAAGVAAVGNVYTRRDRRGRGLASRVTAAVVARLLREGIPTVVLNVNEKSPVAVRVYERLGFRTHCRFLEGPARRSDVPSS